MTQPEALRLADLLLSENAMDCLEHSDDAATELRRLHEENESLRQALAQQKPDEFCTATTEELMKELGCSDEKAKEIHDKVKAIRARGEK